MHFIYICGAGGGIRTLNSVEMAPALPFFYLTEVSQGVRYVFSLNLAWV